MTPLSNAASQGDIASSSRETIAIARHPSSQPLRPATYIRVIDLAQSYNIDSEKIKVEIEKINNAKAEVHSSAPDAKEDSHSLASKTTDESELSGEKKLHATGATKGYPKRLSAMNGGFNLCLLVGKVEVVVDKLRVDKSRVRLAEVQVGDETGSISLRARDDQIDELEAVSKKGGAIVLRNSSIELYQGKHLRLAVTKWGKISVYPDNIASTPIPPAVINTDLNLSIVDLNLLPPDTWLQHPSSASPASHKSAESGSRQGMPTKQNPTNQQHHGNQQYRKKGRGHHHDRRLQSHQPYMVHGNKVPSMQDQNYNPMLAMSQNFMTNMNAFSPMYAGTQYYSSYEDAQMQAVHQQRQRLEQQKAQNPQQQFLLMQQQQFQLQRQMEQMEQILYNQRRGSLNQSTPSQASPGNFPDAHSTIPNSNMPPSGSLLGSQMPPEQNTLHGVTQSISNLTIDQQKTNRDSWPTPTNTSGSPMTMEVPMSPQMNPLAASFAPHYSIPDLGSAMHHSQQQYYLQPQQGGSFTPYNHPSAYAHSSNHPNHQDSSKQANANKQHQGKNI